MTYPHADRRDSLRVSVGFYAQQLSGDAEPQRCFATSLSPTGVFLERPVDGRALSRSSKKIQLELPLPGEGEPIWAQAEVVYDSVGALFHGMGARFVCMANTHRRVLRRWLRRQSAWMEPVDGGAGVRIFRPRRL
ncbi:MAG: PilZ domain-containing protein [Myxococcota bacterium]